MTRKYTVEEIQDIIKAVGITQKNDPASTTLTGQALHGPNLGGSSTTQFGLFSSPGVRPDMLSTLARPRTMASIVTLQRSEYTDELIEIMTGQKDGTGAVSTGYCGDAPRPGDLKVMQRIFKFGNVHLKTSLNALPNMGQLRNRADVPRDILNAGPEGNPLIPEQAFRLGDTRSQLRADLFRVGVQLQRDLEIVMVQGVQGTASTTTRSFQTQFDGLDAQIKTGYADAVSGVATPAVDSAVITFGADIGATISGGDGRNIVQAVTDLVYGINDRAFEVGMEGTTFAFVMRKEAFRALVDQWVCNYATYRCDDGTAGNPVNRDAVAQNQLRIEMLRGQFLLVDGVQYPVVFSEGIVQRQTGTGSTFESDIYFVPLQWQGFPLLRLEYFDMGNAYIQELSGFVGGDMTRVTNNGLYLIGRNQTAYCVEHHFASKMRLILEAPFLAGRCDNLLYSFRAPVKNALPSDTFFYSNGGPTYRA